MKKGLLYGISLLLVLMLTACASVTPTVTPVPTDTPEPVIEQADPYAWIAENDKYAKTGFNNLSVSAVDEFGRTFTGAAADKQEKLVGMFYQLAQGQHGSFNKGIFDTEKIIAEYGTDAVFKQVSDISPNWSDHFWGEPLWGYYTSDDEYVQKKQLEMFTWAGIDYLVLDVTNGFTYIGPTKKLMAQIVKLRGDGWDTPQIVFYVHSLNNKTVRELYRDIYAFSEYSDSWFRKDGKPVIIAYNETEKDKAEAATRGVTDFSSSDYTPLSQEILDYFFFVEPRWPNDGMQSLVGTPIYDKDKSKGFCWIEWMYPAPERKTSLGTFTNVAVASHPNIPFSFSITRGVKNWGRGYNVKTRENVAADINKGTYFQSCWDVALKKNSDTVFLVMWNGWTALKQPYAGEYMLCDTATEEYSLTIEPSKGYYNDSFYLEMIANMRKYKFEGTPTAHRQRTIDINGSFAQWYNVDAVYRQVGSEAYDRKARSIAGKYVYKQDMPANNIQEIRVTHDSNYLYFMLRTEKDITANSGQNWMNVFIGSGAPGQKGWNGYEYVLNRNSSGNTTEITKLNADFTGTKVGNADSKVAGCFMFLRVPRNLVGMATVSSLYFKAADSVAAPADIMDYYVSGSVLPMGRLSFEYNGK